MLGFRDLQWVLTPDFGGGLASAALNFWVYSANSPDAAGLFCCRVSLSFSFATVPKHCNEGYDEEETRRRVLKHLDKIEQLALQSPPASNGEAQRREDVGRASRTIPEAL